MPTLRRILSGRTRTVFCIPFVFSTALLVHAVPAAVSHDATECLDEYRALAEQIKQKRSLAKTLRNESVQVLDRQALIRDTDQTPVDVVLRRTEALLDHLSAHLPAEKSNSYRQTLNRLREQAQASLLSKSPASAETGNLALFSEITSLRKQLAFDNPLLNFNSFIFTARLSTHGEPHMVNQYWGYAQKTGGSIYMARNAFSGSPEVVDLLKNSTVQSGRYKGRKISGSGSFLSPELSYDGKTIYFAWSECGSGGNWSPERCFHIFKVNIDGSGLTQLTDGAWNEFDPCELPNGRIVFISERRGGFGRCHDMPKPTFTLHSMKPDGSDIVCLSYHETNEWHPSVDHNGMIVYSRWDYVDRDSDCAHHIWLCTPDGRDPRAPHGNYPHPLTTINEVPWYKNNWGDGRGKRPWMELNIRAVPNSHKYMATAAPHHGHAFGSFVMIDTRKEDDNVMSQLEKITPDKPFPEAQTGVYQWGPYGTAWPLSEDVYLCNYNDDICYLDRFGNRETIIKQSQAPNSSGMPLIDPIPVRARTKPPVLPTRTFQGERASLAGHKRAVISISNVYEADLPWPDGGKLKGLRFDQVFSKTTPNREKPKIGIADAGNTRMALGVVPIEEDGSVYCEAPVEKSIYFQVLDEDRAAVQSMRSDTYVHPGEHLSCFGCHEDKWKAIPPLENPPLAMRRAPSKLEPDYGGVEPMSFYRLVKPVLENTCVPCHKQKSPSGPTGTNYGDWATMGFYFHGDRGDITKGTHGGSRSIPGYFGARYCKLGKAVLSDSHKKRLTEEQRGRIVLWVDNMTNEYGDYHDLGGQSGGKLVWPKLDVDPNNPNGVEYDREIPGDDEYPPRLSSVLAQSETSVTVVFNEPVTQASAQNTGNYTISGGVSVVGAVLEADNMTVKLTTSALTLQTTYTLTVSTILDRAKKPNTLRNQSVSFAYVQGTPLGNGYFTKLLCLENSQSSACLAVDAASAVEQKYAGNGKPIPCDGETVAAGGEALTWNIRSDDNGTWADGPEDNFVSFWHITVMSPQKHDVKLIYRHDDDITVRHNGSVVASRSGWDENIEQHSDVFSLVEGDNHFLFKLLENGGGNRFAAKLVDASNNAVPGLLYRFPEQGSTIFAGYDLLSSAGGAFSPLVYLSGKQLAVSRLHPYLENTITLADSRGRITGVWRTTGSERMVMPATAPYAQGVYLVTIRFGQHRYTTTVVLP